MYVLLYSTTYVRCVAASSAQSFGVTSSLIPVRVVPTVPVNNGLSYIPFVNVPHIRGSSSYNRTVATLHTPPLVKRTSLRSYLIYPYIIWL